jgi:hypothetical protein
MQNSKGFLKQYQSTVNTEANQKFRADSSDALEAKAMKRTGYAQYNNLFETNPEQ